jgi:hypothetical protein
MEHQIKETIGQLIDSLTDAVRIRPSNIAEAVYFEYDPQEAAPIEIKYAAICHYKQLAREALRGKFEADNSGQPDLFPGLQDRYPEPRNDKVEPSYIRREDMSGATARFNIDRLRAEAETKLKHADALEQWALERGLLLSLAA